jgi:dGTPase
LSIRERIERNEELTLIPEACFSKNSKGREIKEELDSYRTCFMHDRDRIIHSKSFRRLKHKTQVYIKTTGDHYRTRLTHTLEVSQIARTIARGIAVNEDLVEAITLGHDLGHVAFAHNGEEVLDERLPGGFRHNEQSVRVLKKLEKDGKGLNITYEVLDGILHHSGLKSGENSSTIEGQIARFADKIAYVNHDIDDSIRAGLLKVEDLPEEHISVLGYTHSKRIDTLVRKLVDETNRNISKGVFTVALPEDTFNALYGLRKYLFENIYLKEERDKAKFLLGQLYDYYMKRIEEMPELYRSIAEEEGKDRAVADYIAGMTDDYAIILFNQIFVPKIVIY